MGAKRPKTCLGDCIENNQYRYRRLQNEPLWKYVQRGHRPNGAVTRSWTISNNITNINTVGFKVNTKHLFTLVAASNARSTPGVSGLLHNTAVQIDSQGNLRTTENPTDISTTGGCFFVVDNYGLNSHPIGDALFTRAGHFSLNRANLFANASDHFLMGWKLDGDGSRTYQPADLFCHFHKLDR